MVERGKPSDVKRFFHGTSINLPFTLHQPSINLPSTFHQPSMKPSDAERIFHATRRDGEPRPHRDPHPRP